MPCENCGRLTEGGYCDCMIVDGEFKGAHWRKNDEGDGIYMGRKSPKNYEDIIANLVRRVAQLESELTGAKRDIETWAQEVEGLRNDLAGYRDDYLAIDERSREAQTITLDVETFTKIIGGDRR